MQVNKAWYRGITSNNKEDWRYMSDEQLATIKKPGEIERISDEEF